MGSSFIQKAGTNEFDRHTPDHPFVFPFSPCRTAWVHGSFNPLTGNISKYSAQPAACTGFFAGQKEKDTKAKEGKRLKDG